MRTLFISYNGALEPLTQSQGIPYLNGLKDNGIECFLLTFEKEIDKDKINKMRKSLTERGIIWKYLKYHKTPSLPATLFDILSGIVTSVLTVIKSKVSVIHARATVPAAIAFITARITGRKFIFDVRGLMAEEYIDGGMWAKESLNYKLTLRFQKMLLEKADEVIVITENIKDFLMNSDYLKKKSKNITVIPCCVDTGRFSAESSRDKKGKNPLNLDGKFVFLYSGSLGTWYLLDEMIDFFIVARQSIDNAHFLIITRTDKGAIKRAFNEKGLDSDCFTVHKAEFEEMPDYVRMADTGIFFIKPVFSKRSSCPTKFAEYLACGLPVVINDGVGDTGKIVRENRAGVVIKNFNETSYKKAIEKLKDMLREKENLKNRCSRVAGEIFSLDKGVSKYLDVYGRLGCR